jgi:cobalt-zinc-cadmium efflux system outer membrane protein
MAFLRGNHIWLLSLQIIVLAGSQGLAQTELDMGMALEMYVARNPNLQAAREQVEIARGRLNQAGLLPNPEFNFTQEGFPVGQSNASFFNDSTLNFWATQELELGGKRGHRKRVADFDVQATESELQDFIRLGKAAVKEAFVRTYVAQEKLRLTQEQLDSYYQIQDIHRQRVEAGDAAGLAQLRIDLEEVRYISALNEMGTDQATAWSELAAWISWEEPSMATLQLTTDTAELDRSQEELQSIALESRPDLEREMARVAQAEGFVELQESRAIPNLTVGGGYNRDFGTNSYYLALQLPVPLFNRNQGNIGAALAGARRSENLLSWKRVQIRFEVERAFKSYRLQQANLQRLEQTVLQSAVRVAELTQQSYLEGEASLLEYLDALRVKLDASLGFHDLLFQLERARIELEKAVGGELQ